MHLLLQRNQETYNAIAPEFDASRNRVWPEVAELINIYVQPGNRVLDLGCGNGKLYPVLAEKSIHYTGTDFSSALIAGARQKYPEADFLARDVLEPFQSQSFEVVFCLAVLNHIPTKALQLKVVKNIFDSLAPGGCVIMTNWNLWNISAKKNIWRFLARRLFSSSENFARNFGIKKQTLSFFDTLQLWKTPHGNFPLFYHAFTMKRLKKMMKAGGFEISEAYYAKNGKKSFWMNGNNLVIVGRKK